MADELKQINNPIPKKDQPDPEDMGKQLEIILKNMDEADNKGNSSLKASLYKEAQNLFKEFTGQDLAERAKTEAEKEIEAEGSKMISKKYFLSEKSLEKEIEAFKFKQQTFAAEKAWKMLSQEERKKYLNDINNFISAIEKKIEELKKDGFDISKEIFYNMTADGYMLLNLKKSIWNGKMLLPVLLGEGAYKFRAMSVKEFENLMIIMQGFFNLIAKQATEDKLSKNLLYAKRRWQKRKFRKAKEILKSVAGTIKSEEIQETEKMEIRKKLEKQIKEKLEKEIEAEERASLEKLSNIGEVGVLERLRDFERLEKKTDKNIGKEIEKIQKSLEKDTQERVEEEKKINQIMKEQIKKGKISKKRVAYLNEVTAEKEDKNQEAGEKPAEEVLPE